MMLQDLLSEGAELAQLVRWMTLNQEVPGSSLDNGHLRKNLLVLLDKATLPKVVLDNDHLLSLDYENCQWRLRIC